MSCDEFWDKCDRKEKRVIEEKKKKRKKKKRIRRLAKGLATTINKTK